MGAGPGVTSTALWALVPIKPLTQAKSRLAPVLDQGARAALVMAMLRHTLAILSQAPALAQVAVVTADSEVQQVAQAYGTISMPEGQTLGLNHSLTWAAAQAQALGATGILVIPGDLPMLSIRSVNLVLRLGLSSQLLIVPDREEQGTNALLMIPPDLIPFRFGPHSFQRHRAAAVARGLAPVIVRVADLAADLDVPDDLAWAASLLGADYEG